MAAALPSKARISNAISAVEQAGYTPASIHIAPDGSLTIDIARPTSDIPANGDAPASSDEQKKPKKWNQARHAA